MSEYEIKYNKLLIDYKELEEEFANYKSRYSNVIRSFEEKELLKPYQVELLKLQKHLETTNKKLIILCEGRDAAGKGGILRRITRYMNEKHYRIVALGKPTEEQRTQWFFQRYVSQLPHGGEVVLFDRSWYNRSMVEPVFGFCTDDEYKNLLKQLGDGTSGDSDIKSMFGEWKGYYRLRTGNLRIIFWFDKAEDIVYVDYIGPRGDAYK